MNKKILSIFVMIMALSLFGVSCSSNNEDKTGPGGNNGGGSGKTTITDKEILDTLKSVGDINDKTGTETVLLLSGATMTGTTISVKGSGATTAGTGPSIAAVKKIADGLKNIQIKNVKTITVDVAGITDTADQKAKNVKITLTANDNYQFSNNKTTIDITIEISPVQGSATDKPTNWVA